MKEVGFRNYIFLIIVCGIVYAFFLYYATNFLSSYTVSVLSNLFIFIILAISYNLINGVTGQFSLEPNGFVAVGAYVASLLLLDKDSKLSQFVLTEPNKIILELNTTFLPALFWAGVSAAILALILSFPVFRVRGDYLAIVTLGFGFIIRIFAINSESITNGSMGLSGIPKYSNLYWIGGATFIAILAIFNIVYSKYGRAMMNTV